MNIIIIWLTIIFIILPIVGKWDSIVPLFDLFRYKCFGYKINENYYKISTWVFGSTTKTNEFEYHKGIFIGNSTFRFDKPTGIAVLFPPLHLIWWCIEYKLKDI